MMSQYQKWRGHAELVLENYRRNQKWLWEIETDAIYGTSGSEGPSRSSDISDPTNRAAMQLLNARVQQVRREVEAVDRVRRQVRDRPELAELMDMVWLERRCRLYQAAELMGLSYRTVIRHKRRLCNMLAHELGWI